MPRCSYRFRDPDGHRFELYYEVERYDPPEHLRPSLKNQPQRYTGRGAAVKRLDHVNVLAADVRASREFAVEALDYRLYERIELDDGSEAGAWLSVSIAAHELIYTRDAYGARGRLHHLAFWVDTREECLRAADLFLDNDIHIEAAPSKHAIAQGFFLYGIEPRRQPHRGDHRRLLRLRPRSAHRRWSEAERAKGQAWGVAHRGELPHLRHAAGRGTPPCPLTATRSATWSRTGAVARRRRLGALSHGLARRRRMKATWFQGGVEFIRVSREGFERGVRILHFLGGTSLEVAGDRAIAQTKMTISQRGPVEGVECDVVCTGRFYDFLERRDGRWGLVLRQPIYEKDRADPSTRRRELELDQELLGRFPERLPPPRLRADADRLRGQARHARPDRAGGRRALRARRRLARRVPSVPDAQPASRSPPAPAVSSEQR